MTPFDTEVLKILEACKTHARDLYQGANTLRDKALPNLAYHLATLALEEIGKAQLVGMRSMAKRDDPSVWYNKQLDDHVKKLFWALWGRFLNHRPEKGEIESLRNLATTIHENRLRGLYVPSSPVDFVAPRDAIPEGSLDALMNLVDARINMEPPTPTGEFAAEDFELFQWFSAASDDPEKRKFLFSPASFDKMEQEVDPREWMKWLKATLDAADAEARASLDKELKRTPPGPDEAQVEKWQLKIRLTSQSHSIRPKELKHWNERVTWIKLFPVDNKKNQLLAEFRLPKAIPLQGVWFVSLGYANTLFAALNIATGGFFWWYLPAHTSTFYESLVDLESKMAAGIGRSPELKIGWPNAALDRATLDRVILCFAMMPPPDDRPKHEPFSHYLTGVALLAKTDVFLQFEVQAYGAFYASLSRAAVIYGDQAGDEEFGLTFSRIVGEMTGDEVFKAKHSGLIKAYDARTLTVGAITLTEVAEMKIICDGYFVRLFGRLAQEREKNTPSSASLSPADSEVLPAE
jgi:AbiV family abortive infection protein